MTDSGANMIEFLSPALTIYYLGKKFLYRRVWGPFSKVENIPYIVVQTTKAPARQNASTLRKIQGIPFHSYPDVHISE